MPAKPKTKTGVKKAPVAKKPTSKAAPKSETSGFWLMKTEPDVFSFDDLLAAPQQTACWEGVRNYQARNFMRDGMQLGDQVFIYHSSTDVPGIHGIATVARVAYADPSQWDKKSDYFDESAPRDGEPRWIMVDVKAKMKFPRPVTLAQLREWSALDGMALLKKGMRLSVQPVSREHWNFICKQAQVKL